MKIRVVLLSFAFISLLAVGGLLVVSRDAGPDPQPHIRAATAPASAAAAKPVTLAAPNTVEMGPAPTDLSSPQKAAPAIAPPSRELGRSNGPNRLNLSHDLSPANQDPATSLFAPPAGLVSDAPQPEMTILSGTTGRPAASSAAGWSSPAGKVIRLPAVSEGDTSADPGVRRLPPIEIVDIPENRGVRRLPPVEDEQPDTSAPPVVAPVWGAEKDAPNPQSNPLIPSEDAPGGPEQEPAPAWSTIEEPKSTDVEAAAPAELPYDITLSEDTDTSSDVLPLLPPLSAGPDNPPADEPPTDDASPAEADSESIPPYDIVPFDAPAVTTPVETPSEGPALPARQPSVPWREPTSERGRLDRPWSAGREDSPDVVPSPYHDAREANAEPAPLTPQQVHEAVSAVRNRVQSHIQRGTDLADRRAFYSARIEFIGALRLLAQALDARQGATGRSDALARGLWALEEAEDFIPRSGAMNVELDMPRRIAVHRTTILKPQTEGTMTPNMTPLRAVQAYYTYAQEQLAAAANPTPEGSQALSALGKLYAQMDTEPTRLATDARTKGLVFQQAALIVNSNNAKAANELGVLLAREGRYAEARDWLRHSVNLLPQREAWHNLSVVHSHLGESQLAAAAHRQSVALADRDAAGRPLPVAGEPRVQVKQVSPTQFSGVTPKPTVDRSAQPNPRAAERTKQPSTGLWDWLPWR